MEPLKLFSGTFVITSDIKILSLCDPFSIHVYGFFACLGVLSLFFLTALDLKRHAILTFEQHSSIFSWMIIAGVVGARALSVLTDYSHFILQPLNILRIWDGGLSLMGGILGVILVSWLLAKIQKINFLNFADLISIYAPLMQAIARLGCFFAGCCYGAPVLATSNALFAVVYKNPTSLAPLNTRLYPVQLYSLLLSLFIFLIIFGISRFKRARSGFLFFLYLFLEGVARGGVDFYRGNRFGVDLNIFSASKITLSQTLAFFIAMIGLLGLAWLFFANLNKQTIIRD